MRASASRLATVQWARARAESASLVRRSFHTPRPPEAIATVYGSLTGRIIHVPVPAEEGVDVARKPVDPRSVAVAPVVAREAEVA